MATATLNTSDQYVKLLVTTSCSLSGNYPNIKVNTSYNFKFNVPEIRQAAHGTVTDLPLMERGKHRM